MPALRAIAQRRCHRAVDVGLARDHHAIAEGAGKRRPVGCDIGSQPGDVLDDDGLAAVDDTDGLHPQCAAGAGLDGAHRDLQRPVRHRAVEGLAHLLHLDAERVGDHPELSLPLTGDGARHG